MCANATIAVLILLVVFPAFILQGCGSNGGSTTTTAAPPAHRAPNVSDTWTATYEGVNPQMAHMFPHDKLSFKLAFDLRKQRFYSSMIVPSLWNLGQGPLIENLFSEAANAWQLTKVGLCAPQDMDWQSVSYIYGFGWLADATWKQHKVVHDTPCDVWTHEQTNAYHWSACVSLDGIPLEYTIIPQPEEVGSTLSPFLSMVNLTVSNFSSTSRPEDFQQSDACKVWPPAACPDHSVKPAKIYRMCSTCFDNPADENAGDFVGMLSAICGAAAGGGFIPGASRIVQYDMMLNQSFGPFQMFNYCPNKHKAIGSKGLGDLVGKSIFNNACSAFPNATDCGQCTDNREGNWFSFPSSGKCETGKDVGSQGCTWNVTSYGMKKFSCVAPAVKDPCMIYNEVVSGRHVEPAKLQKAMGDILANLSRVMGPESHGGCPDVPITDEAIIQV